jgi:glycine/D-amino acid oxidase-like deaminating enzyme
MQVDYLIVGQGICGTMLSWFLHKEGKSFLVVDDNDQNSSSKVAAGIINPVTGRRYVYTWMIDEVMPFAIQTYKEMGSYLETDLVSEKSIIDFFTTPQMRNAFIDRLTENDTYLHSYPDQNHFNGYFHYYFGCGEICPAFMIHLQELMDQWRKKLSSMNSIWEEKFVIGELQVEKEHVYYKEARASRIIFCDGSGGFDNPWFHLLPYAPNKGEALIVECEDLLSDHVFKIGLLLAPLPAKNIFWVGSNYQWEFDNAHPSTAFYQHATGVLKGWIKSPFKILEHKASVRPATIERRPFVGFHPMHENIGILNGMGTKGSSLAPFFANQLVQHLVYGLPVSPEADVHRFSRVLSRTES